MSFRFVIITTLAGIVSAAAFVPWSMEVREQALLGLRAEPMLAIVGYALACMAWSAAGGLVTTRPLVRPYLNGPLAGFIAAGVSAWLVWLPAVNVWALHDLWAVAATSPDAAAADEIVGISTSKLLHYSVLGFWGHTGLGAAMGILGTVFTSRFRKTTPALIRTPVLWPLRVWVWSVVLIVGGLVALQQKEFEVVWTKAAGHGWFEPLELLLLNGAILGALVAGLVGAIGVRYTKSALPTLRRLGLIIYAGVSVSTAVVWIAVVPVLAPHAITSPFYIAYCAAPLLAAAIGTTVGWSGPVPPIPRVSDIWAEMAMLLLTTGPLVAGAGLGAAAWSSTVGPLVWGNVMTGVSDWSNLNSTVAEIFAMQALAWLPLLAVVLLEGPLVILPALAVLRRSALRQAEYRNSQLHDVEASAELEYDATVPRMAALGSGGIIHAGDMRVDAKAKTVSRATEPVSEVELETEPGHDVDDVGTERIGSVDPDSRVSTATDG